MSDIDVRMAASPDAEAIMAIYNREVMEASVTFDLVARTLEEQQAWLVARSGAHPAIVAVDRATAAIVGFGSLSPYRERPAYSTSVEDSVYVHADHRGRGVGREVLDELIRLGTAHGFHTIIGRVVGGHTASIALHRSCGFEEVGTEREIGRKFGRWLDVVIMQRLL